MATSAPAAGRGFVMSSTRRAAILVAALAVTASGAGCGGAGGATSGETLVGVVLVNFEQSGHDNVPLNRVLEFVFSSPIDPDSVGPASIQMRQGPAFGAAFSG